MENLNDVLTVLALAHLLPCRQSLFCSSGHAVLHHLDRAACRCNWHCSIHAVKASTVTARGMNILVALDSRHVKVWAPCFIYALAALLSGLLVAQGDHLHASLMRSDKGIQHQVLKGIAVSRADQLHAPLGYGPGCVLDADLAR